MNYRFAWISAGAAAVVAVGLVTNMAFYRDKTEAPLALLHPENIIEVRSLSGGGPLPTASLLSELAEAPQSPAIGINWTGARLLRVQLRDDVQLTMQVVPDGPAAWVRITGDATQAGKAELLALAFRRLRNNALHVSGASAVALLGDLRESPLPTNISTITGNGVKQEHDLPREKNS